MDYLDLLSALKVGGFLVTAASSVWALTQKLSAEDEKGRKRLTAHGWVALSLIIAGAVTSFLSFDLEGRKRAEDAIATHKKEALRLKRIIAAGQPITSLDIEWRFSDVDAGLIATFNSTENRLKELPETHEERFKNLHGAELQDSINTLKRHWQLYPLMQRIAGAKQEDPSVIVLLALDNSASTVLPFGVLEYSPTPEAKGLYDEAERINYHSTYTKEAAAGIDFHDDVDHFFKMDEGVDRVRRSPFAEGNPILTRHNNDFVINWQLPAVHFADAIDRVPGGTMTPASLPETLRIIILYRLVDLPARPSNFAAPQWRANYFGDSTLLVASANGRTPNLPYKKSVLRVTANELFDVGATYDVEAVKRVLIANKNDEMRKDYCNALILVGKRRPD